MTCSSCRHSRRALPHLPGVMLHWAREELPAASYPCPAAFSPDASTVLDDASADEEPQTHAREMSIRDIEPRRKRSNSRSRSACGIPMPPSWITRCARSPSRVAEITGCSTGLYFRAFSTGLSISCSRHPVDEAGKRAVGLQPDPTQSADFATGIDLDAQEASARFFARPVRSTRSFMKSLAPLPIFRGFACGTFAPSRCDGTVMNTFRAGPRLRDK